MLYKCYETRQREGVSNIKLEKTGSFFSMTGSEAPAISICANPSMSYHRLVVSIYGTDLQIYHKFKLQLQKQSFLYPDWIAKDTAYGNNVYFELMRQYLKECGKIHQCSPGELSPLPKRLIDVRSTGEPEKVHLYETKAGERGKYIALSHIWGDPPEHPRFYT
jgi:hypothetical protein